MSEGPAKGAEGEKSGLVFHRGNKNIRAEPALPPGCGMHAVKAPGALCSPYLMYWFSHLAMVPSALMPAIQSFTALSRLGHSLLMSTPK